MTVIRAQNSTEAFQIAEQLKRRGDHDWFRGQRRDWPLRSSFLRLGDEERNGALEKMARLGHWVESTKGLEDLASHPDMAIAVAQHYGLPTNFIDFTTEPKIAAFFATDGWKESGSAEGVIMCLSTKDLLKFWEAMPEKYRSPECLALSVKNLWRLEAQHGTFLFCPYDNFEQIYDLDRIIFPHTDDAPPILREMIYPSRESELEILLRQFFMNERLIEASRAPIPENAGVVTFEPPGEYGDPDLLRVTPPPFESWNDNALEAWLFPDAERFRDCHTEFALEISDNAIPTAGLLGTVTRQNVINLLSGTPKIRAKSVRFLLKSHQQLRLGFLERLWDGLRRLPFTDEEIAEGMGNAMTLFDTRRRRPERHDMDWGAEAEACFGKVIEVEFGADDGSYSRGFVSRQQLLAAVRGDIAEFLSADYKMQVLGNMTGLLQAVFVPSRLFEFAKLAKLFATQLAPVQVLMRDQAIYYSPARLTKFGLP